MFSLALEVGQSFGIPFAHLRQRRIELFGRQSRQEHRPLQSHPFQERAPHPLTFTIAQVIERIAEQRTRTERI